MSSMASILRSAKFVRYIAGYARNVVLNPPREFNGNLRNNSHSFCDSINRSLASQAHSQQHEESLDETLRKLDNEVRKIGRISREQVEEILDEIKNTRSATSSQSLLVIRCCGNLVPEELPERRTTLVQEIWATLNKLSVPMDISHYNALLRVYLENEHEFSPTEFLADLGSKGLEPNRVTYQRLISRYCQIGDVDGATKILQFMRDKQMPINESVFNALVLGHFYAGDESSAKNMLTLMRKGGIEPNTDTYITFLCGYAKNGNIDAINNTLDECNKEDIYLSDKDYLEVVYALALNGHHDHIPTILGKLKRSYGYNQEAINLILRLITKGEEDAGFLVLNTLVRSVEPTGEIINGLFFIKQLVKANRPVEKIISFCEKLEKDETFPKVLSVATETSLKMCNHNLAYPLIEELGKKNVPVRQHFFWPLLMAKTEVKPEDNVIEVLVQMQKFGLSPNGETIRDYVIPNIKGNSSEILSVLRTANISLAIAGGCLTHYLLTKHDLKEAAVISSQIGAYYNPEILRRPLTNAFYKTKDLESYIKVVRNIYDNLDRYKRNEENEEESNTIDKNQAIGNLILDLTNRWEVDVLLIKDVLEGLVNEGLSISTKVAIKIEGKLGEKMTDSISSLLQRLTSGELIPTPIAKKPSYVPSSQMNAEQLERLIFNLEAKNQETKGLKRQLLSVYHRDKNLLKTEELLKDLEKGDFVYTKGVYAQLIDLYTHHENVDKAIFYYNKLKEAEGDFTMDASKTVAFAHLLVKAGKFQEGIDILEETPYNQENEGRGYNYNAQVWRFLNYMAEEGRVDDLNTVFNILVKNKFIEVNNVLLGPLIKVHLIKNDLQAAVEKFEWCVNQFRATPWKNELTCKLIQIEDGDNLQKLTDLSTAIHGEINSLYDLVFAFVECGRIRQARKILETPGMQTRPQRMNTRCERYRQEGNIKPLEDLREATKDLDHINRSDIYYQLLLGYIKQDEPDKALGLWTQMQEEDLPPTEQFLSDLGTFLMSKRLNVPFVMPSLMPSVEAKTKKSTKSAQSIEQSLDSNNSQLFRRKLKAGDIEGALTHYTSPDKHSISDISLLVEKLLQASKVEAASTVTLDLLNRGTMPLLRVFKFYLNRLVANGDVQTLEIINSKVSTDVKKNVSFDNRVCHANLVAGRAVQYLEKLENEIDNASQEDVKGIEEKFPRGGAYGILEKHNELVDKFENLAIKYSNRGIVAPFNVLWTHHFISGNDTKAEEIWNNYLKNTPRIMFQKIVHTARENNDENLIKKLIKHLKRSNVTEGAIGNAYSCYLDVITAKSNSEEVINSFETIVKEFGLDYINRTAVLRVKDHYEKSGKPFNYTIPPKNLKNTTASLEEER